MEDEPEKVYSASFARLPRQKTLLIWSTHQMVIAAVILLVFLTGLAGGNSFFSPVTVVLACLLVFDLWVVHGLSLWQILALRLGFLLRRATGTSKATLSPVTAGSAVALLDIPGIDGTSVKTYEIINTPFHGACFRWDVEKAQATAVVRALGTSSVLSGAGDKNAKSNAFSTALNSLIDRPDVEKVTIQSRSLLMPTAVDEIRDDASFAERDMHELQVGALSSSLMHDYIIGITVTPGKSQQAKDRNSSVRSMSELLSRRVDEVVNSLQAAGVDRGPVWMNAQQLRGSMKTLTDPDAWALLNERGELPDETPVATSYEEFDDCIAVGPSYARTYWIDQWPSADTKVPAGWLAGMAQPDMQVVFTEVFRRRPEKEAKGAVEGRLQEADSMVRFNSALGRVADRKTVAEAEVADEQLKAISTYGGDVRFQCFVTVISGSHEQLDADCSKLSIRLGGVHLDDMKYQQLSLWAGALPCGLAGRES